MSRPILLILIASVLLSACQSPKIKPTSASEACPRLAPLARKPRFELTHLQSGLPLTGNWRERFALADINGDGHLDLLHGPPRKGNFQPHIFLGDGHGGFALDTDAHWPPLPFDYGGVAAADFNRDGVEDLALGAHLRGLVVMINESKQSFAPWSEGLSLALPSQTPDQPIFASRALAAIDWNRDGMVDLLAANEGPTMYATDRSTNESVRLYLNRNGLFELRDTSQTVSGWSNAIAVGDVTGDRWPEAVTGTARYGNRRLVHVGLGGDLHSQALQSLPSNAAVFAVHIAAMHADRPNSILFGTSLQQTDDFCSTLIQTEFNVGSVDQSETLWSEPGTDWLIAIQDADLDGDGQRELIALHRSGKIRVLQRQKSGWQTALLADPPEKLLGCLGADLALGNIDQDPAPELVVSYAGDNEVGGIEQCSSNGGLTAFDLTASH